MSAEEDHATTRQGGPAWNADNNSDSEVDTRIYGIIYVITSPHLTDGNGQCKKYIGSTTQTLERRISHHKNLKANTSASRYIIEAGDATAKILECGMYTDITALHVRERYYIELDRELVVNIQIPSRTRHELLNSKVKCPICSFESSYPNLARHIKSHQ